MNTNANRRKSEAESRANRHVTRLRDEGPTTIDHLGRVWPPIRDDALPAEIVLPRLERVHDRGEQRWTALCPAHTDRTPSLSVHETETRDLLLMCFAGCAVEKVCSALGLTLAHLFATKYAVRRKGTSSPTIGTKPRTPNDDPDLTPDPKFATHVQEYRQHPDRAQRVRELSALLGVSSDSLNSLRIGWTDVRGGRWTVPERDDQFRVVGIALRHPDGLRTSLSGSRRGLYIPRPLTRRGTLYVCEGVSDTAAMLDAGRHVVGRSSASPSLREQIWLMRVVQSEGADAEVVVVGDRDDAGVEGARSVAAWLAEQCGRAVRWGLPMPGHKDVREQWQATGTAKLKLQR